MALPLYVIGPLRGGAGLLGLPWAAYCLGEMVGSIIAGLARRVPVWPVLMVAVVGWGVALAPLGLLRLPALESPASLSAAATIAPTYKDYWELPRGAVEADESPYDAAVREVTEELGIVVTPGQLLVVDWVPPQADRTEGLIVVFDGGLVEPVLAAQIRLGGSELRSWAWSTLPEADTRLSPLLARRVRAAVRAAAAQASTYLENGVRRA